MNKLITLLLFLSILNKQVYSQDSVRVATWNNGFVYSFNLSNIKSNIENILKAEFSIDGKLDSFFVYDDDPRNSSSIPYLVSIMSGQLETNRIAFKLYKYKSSDIVDYFLDSLQLAQDPETIHARGIKCTSEEGCHGCLFEKAPDSKEIIKCPCTNSTPEEYKTCKFETTKNDFPWAAVISAVVSIIAAIIGDD